MKNILKSLMVYKGLIYTAEFVIVKRDRRDVLTYNNYLAPNEFGNVIFRVENELIAYLLDPNPEEPKLANTIRNSLYSFCNAYRKAYKNNKKKKKPFNHPNITIWENSQEILNPFLISGKKTNAANSFTSKQTTSVNNILQAISNSRFHCVDLSIFNFHSFIEPISLVECSLYKNIVSVFYENGGFRDKLTGEFIDVDNRDVIDFSNTFANLTHHKQVKNIPQLRKDIENREITFPIISKVTYILELYLKEYYQDKLSK